MGLQRSEKFLKREKGLRDVKEGGISARKAGQMRPGTEHEEIQEIHTPGKVRLNGRVTFDGRFTDWLIELANRGFGLACPRMRFLNQ